MSASPPGAGEGGRFDSVDAAGEGSVVSLSPTGVGGKGAADPPSVPSEAAALYIWCRYMGKSLRNNARKLKALGLIDYDLRRELTPGQKGNITRLAKQYSGAIDRPKEFVRRTVSKKTGKLLKESGYQSFKSKKTGKQVAVIPHNGASKVQIKNERIKKVFETHTETSLLFLRKHVLERLEVEARRHEYLYGDDYSEGKFFSVKIGDAHHWYHFRSAQVLLDYISDWQPKDTLNPNSKNFGNANLKSELITQMALIERNENNAVSYSSGNVRKAKKRNATKAKKNLRNRR